MHATRVHVHLGSAFEWVVALVFLLATVSVASLIVRELNTPARTTPPVSVVAPATALPASVPARAVSVPALLLLDGRQIRIGDTLPRVDEVIGGSVTAREATDRGALGERVTRFYESQGMTFVLVFEPFERDGALRVAAIYLP